jgi:hypothetical protein
MTLTAAQRQTLSWIAISLLVALVVWLLAPGADAVRHRRGAGVRAAPAGGAPGAPPRAARRRGGVVEGHGDRDRARGRAADRADLSKQLPLLREQIPLFADRANATLTPLLSRIGIDVALDTASIKAFVLKYLNANVEDWTATALSSGTIGGSILPRDHRQPVPRAAGAVLPADGLEQPARPARCADPPRLRERTKASSTSATACSANTCAASCSVMLAWRSTTASGSRCSASIWRCRWACSPAWRSSSRTSASASA